MENTLIVLYCIVDDFLKEFLSVWSKKLISDEEDGVKRRNREGKLSMSEIMTIYIHFHQSHYRDFKTYYMCHISQHMRHLFPDLVCYPRFTTLIKSIIVPLVVFLHCFSGEKTGIYFIDSTTLKVCNIKRCSQNKVFKGVAKKGKSTIGWFFGFKLHIVINDKGELMAFKITAGNADDRKPVPDLVKALFGKLFGDKGYISQELFKNLFGQGLQLITGIKKSMKGRLMHLADKLLLRKRSVIECVNDQLKNISQIEHTRHRSVWNFLANILAGLAAYVLQPKKPSIRKDIEELLLAYP